MNEAIRTHRKRGGGFQFRIGTVLLLMIPIGYGFVQLSRYLDSRPVQWQSFSQANLDQELADGKTVVVFLDDSYQGLEANLKKVFDHDEIRRFSRSSQISMMIGKYGHSKYPEHSAGSYGSLISIFHPGDPTVPIEFAGHYSDDIAEEVLAELQSSITNNH